MINLNRKLADQYKKEVKPKRKLRKPVLIAVVVLLILSVLSFFYYKNLSGSAKETTAHAKALSAAYKNQNLDDMRREATLTRQSLEKTHAVLGLVYPVKFIPIVGGYYADSLSFSGAGIEELRALEVILAELDPFKNELGFTGQPHIKQDRITQAMKILEKAAPKLNKVSGNLKKASDDVQDINTDKYPDNLKGIKLKENLKLAKEFIVGFNIAVSKAAPALAGVPDALGQSSPKTYLMLFQNDKEIRPTGGFLTAFAFLKLDKGQIASTISDDIYRLDERLLNVCLTKICPLTPPDPIVRYLPEVTGKPRTAWSMRDSNISPDVPTAAKEFERMFGMLGDGTPFDGIVYIDSQVVEQLIELTGPIDVYGTKFSADKDPRCNCPNVIYELESYAEITAKGTQERKAILGILMQQLLAKMAGADIGQMPEYLDRLVTLSNHKHIMLYMHDSKLQDTLSAFNWTGEVKNYDGDYLYINDANFAGGKSNLYVEQTVTEEVEKDKDGSFKHHLTIEYKNPQPFGIWLNNINRDYVRVYLPKGSKLVSSKGSDDPVQTFDELGKTVFSAFISVRPQNSRKLEFEYIIPYKTQNNYKMLIQKQPGAKDFKYIIKYNGREKQSLSLDMDKEIIIDL